MRMNKRIDALFAGCFLLFTSGVSASPTMGWNSWDSFGCTLDEAQAKAQCDVQAEKLLAHGYDLFTVDIDWYSLAPKGHDYPPKAPLELDEFGRYMPPTNRWPSAANGAGFRPLGEYVHAKGLKFGIHIMRGIPREAVRRNLKVLGTNVGAADIANVKSVCKWNPRNYGVDMTKDGAQAYYDSIFKLYAEWGVDFVKVDDIARPYDDGQLLEIEAIVKAIGNSGRKMTLSLSPGDTPLSRGEHVTKWANQWRISDDFWDDWKPLKEMFWRLDKWTPYRREGHFPDADMIPLGKVKFGRDCLLSAEEQKLLMTLWCVARSPLILGCDMTKLDDATMALIANDEVLAANQASGMPKKVSEKDGLIVWANDDLSGGKYVALFNITDGEAATVGVELSEIGMSGTCRVRDLWARKWIGYADAKIEAKVPAHGAVFYRVSPAGELPIPQSQGTCVAPNGDTIQVTTKCIRFNGAPSVGVMGEMHYARVPPAEWRDYVRKMREGGLTTLATYVFWCHHEEEEGKFDFAGRRDLGAFLKVCEEEKMPVVLRLGPWCHGECREGGFPDWLVEKCKGGKPHIKRLRSTDGVYLGYVERFWKEVYKQVDGHLFKQGGCVVGCQLENECRGPWPYMMALKNLARKCGFDVPYYTRTGWPAMKGKVDYGEMLPLYGDYADGFWERKHEISPKCYQDAFFFKSTRTSANIATEQLKASELGKDAKDVNEYPYLTCELGGGMPSSYSRRLQTFPMDALAMAVVKLGSGSNLLGYYMYAGGTNPNRPLEGKFFNESTRGKFTNHNDLPPFSYEFYGPISEYGECTEVYYVLKELHEFCAKYGAELALEEPVIVASNEAKRGRFVFHNDYVRGKNMEGDCWIGVEEKVGGGGEEKVGGGGEEKVGGGGESRRVRKILEGKALVAKVAAEASAKAKGAAVAFRQVKAAGAARKVEVASNGLPMQPTESDWDLAAEYEIELERSNSKSEILAISYVGDCARVYVDGVPYADDFYKGLPMKVGVWRLPKGKVTVRILPWQDLPGIYVQSPWRPTECGEKLIGIRRNVF